MDVVQVDLFFFEHGTCAQMRHQGVELGEARALEPWSGCDSVTVYAPGGEVRSGRDVVQW